MSDCISELIIPVNQVIGNIQDNYESKIEEIELWQNKLLRQTKKESTIKQDSCEICNSKDKVYCELHHVAGRKFDFRTITACILCHRWLSDRQKIWDARWINNSDDQNLKTAFFYMGLYDILILKSKKTCCTVYEDIAYSYIEIISRHLKEAK